MKFLRIVLLFAFPVYLASCGTQKKLPPYYLDKATDTTKKSEVKFTELKIQKNDKLSIQVYSASTAPEVDALYNLPVGEGGLGGFLVDARGNIEYPRLGTIHAEGMTKNELADVIKNKLTSPVELLRNPTVIIRFMDLKINVLGEVGSQGLVTIPGENATILDAIGLAGGVTNYGKKDNVKIIREANGQREIGYVDLSSDSLFFSPYYNLVQNDVLIVAPTKQRMKDEDQVRTAQKISFALTLVTVAATLYGIFR